MSPELLAKLEAITSQNEIDREVKVAKQQQAKAIKKAGVVLFRTEGNKLGAYIPTGMSITKMNTFKEKFASDIEEFKNGEDKTKRV